MKTRIIVAAALLAAVSASIGEARTVDGPRGGTGTASFSGTTANGRSESGSASATYHPSTGTVTGNGSMTGPAGGAHGGTVTADDGSATVTGNNGQSKNWARPQ